MADDNAPVTRHHRNARERLQALHARHEHIRALIAAHLAETSQQAGEPPQTPTTEAHP